MNVDIRPRHRRQLLVRCLRSTRACHRHFPSSIRPAFLIPLLVGSVALTGCFELIRRPATNAGAAGNSDLSAEVIQATTDPLPARPDSSHEAPTVDENGTQRPPRGPVTARVEPQGLTGGPRDGIKRVNEYVLWCIRQGMWGEAQHHLEQSLQTDSTAASIHNNLGIVYERMGERAKAAAAYARASRLGTDNEVYRMNLQLLEQSARFERPDTLPTTADEPAAAAIDSLAGSTGLQ